jgi:hypothetical protein
LEPPSARDNEGGFMPGVDNDISQCCMGCENLARKLEHLESLVREMGEILRAALPLTIASSDWAIKYNIDSLNDEALAVNALFFRNDNDGILTRPEVKKIMGEKQ